MRRTVEAAPSVRGVGEIGASIVADIPAVEERAGPRRWPQLDRSELLLLGVFAAVSVWVIGLDVWQVLVDGRTWTGTDGVYITDQMQYLAWITSASHTGLIADLFVVHPTSAVYLHPGILVSGALAATGVAPAVALLIWKPVAVVGLFFAFRAYTVRTVEQPGRLPKLAILTLALFYGCFSSVYGSFGVVGDMFPGFLAWGYPFALLGIALQVAALLSYDRARSRGRPAWAPGLLGALAGSLHPWQGEVFILIVIGAELFGGGLTREELRRGLGSPRIRLATRTVTVAAVPLLYYFALGKLNSNWELGQAASKHAFPAIAIGLALAPLALVALLGLRGSAGGFMGRSVRAWPVAAVLLYLQSYTSQGATPLHAFDGITLPLAVLAVNGSLRSGWMRVPRPRVVAVCLIALFTIPTTYYEMKEARRAVLPLPNNPNFIKPSESRALAWLREYPRRGGVITSPYLGMTIPSSTGRHSYDGNCIWAEPDCYGRDSSTEALIAGTLPASQAQQLITSSHARFLLVGCGSPTSAILGELRPITGAVHRFGCASVIEVRD